MYNRDKITFSLLLVSCFLLLSSCQPTHHPSVIASASTVHPEPFDTPTVHPELVEGERSAAQDRHVEGQSPHLAPIHFPTGRDIFRDEELSAFQSNISWLEKNPRAVLVLEGHCDERGGDLYNMELGDRRARRVKSHLISNGIDADRLIMVVSYGERQPVDPRHTPNAWNKNRRVEFIVR